ncbi:2-hydroxychromene-2-carboxylate isomerase [Reyranella sp. CPCC 100927]|uniref:2-hydroxychromene-2-carboxylate isomerase n=1 Tax=Reyranella sp. CPCC 100927 TaxID=2599616 RepID=UPI0011B715AC|nr:2-hydroxychromene-2-carboxylate isomerase [Reyranella sp. CPCC 100927]TWT10121.1 2-hydroxychromene-2-carboxylate isomerase [Reyranella sp. CPCC 100927]
MVARIEFFFDCSSPWTYLAFHAVQPIAAETGAEIDWKPILVGGIFNTVNDTVYKSRETPNPRKLAYTAKDMADWARLYGLRIKMRPTVFPVNSVKCMRGAFVALEKGKLVPYAYAAFDAYWGDDKDISKDDVMAEVVDKVGLDRSAFFAKIADPSYKDRLRANTDDVIARGGFGSPTMFVNGSDMYFGNDRLPLLREALKRAA